MIRKFIKRKMKTDNEIKEERDERLTLRDKIEISSKKKKRIWIFIAYQKDKWGSIPVFSKLFDDHNELKEFSGKHSAENKDKIEEYHSTYLDLTDTSFITNLI